MEKVLDKNGLEIKDGNIVKVVGNGVIEKPLILHYRDGKFLDDKGNVWAMNPCQREVI